MKKVNEKRLPFGWPGVPVQTRSGRGTAYKPLPYSVSAIKNIVLRSNAAHATNSKDLDLDFG
ncbi:hypothetical protein ACQKLP_24535 [Chitinophaga sp. NPDC101104]|uniref:hypothetical protein n=1 Tax=Chitinophaga sp. NPDC101104 TaxID=3390561 RepID=UPI003D0477E3